MEIYVYWLIAGVLLMVLEFAAVPMIGFAFTGLGAFTTGVMIKIGIIGQESLVFQFAVFSASTVLWAAALWKHLKKRARSYPKYSNIEGQTAVVMGEGLESGKTGQVKWSGTAMQARIENGEGNIPAGEEVTIVKTEGITLIVKRK